MGPGSQPLDSLALRATPRGQRQDGPQARLKTGWNLEKRVPQQRPKPFPKLFPKLPGCRRRLMRLLPQGPEHLEAYWRPRSQWTRGHRGWPKRWMPSLWA